MTKIIGYYGIYRMYEQRRLRRACASRSLARVFAARLQMRGLDEVSGQLFKISSPTGYQKNDFTQMRYVPNSHELVFTNRVDLARQVQTYFTNTFKNELAAS